MYISSSTEMGSLWIWQSDFSGILIEIGFVHLKEQRYINPLLDWIYLHSHRIIIVHCHDV